MKAMILAAGKGTRLQPLTHTIPKPMIPLLGKPVMEFLVEHLKAYGTRKIMVNTSHLADSIKNYFGNGKQFGVEIGYSFEGSLQDGEIVAASPPSSVYWYKRDTGQLHWGERRVDVFIYQGLGNGINCSVDLGTEEFEILYRLVNENNLDTLSIALEVNNLIVSNDEADVKSGDRFIPEWSSVGSDNYVTFELLDDVYISEKQKFNSQQD